MDRLRWFSPVPDALRNILPVARAHSSNAREIGVVHLAWAPFGSKHLRAFLRSYREHPAGVPHDLVILFNGEQADGLAAQNTDDAPLTLEGLAAELGGVEHRLIVLKQPLLDLAAYHEAARQLEYAQLCFLNSYSVVLVDGWLAHLAHAAALPDVGMAGATGSWESRAKLVNGSAMHWLYQLAKLPEKRHDFPGFPNPHIRTTAFMLKRELLLELGMDRAHDKRAAYRLESGRHSITRQIQGRGLRSVLVGRDGHAYDVEEWPRSRTFRRGEQSNLLVADNRTEQWREASPEMRRSLSGYAWGKTRDPTA